MDAEEEGAITLSTLTGQVVFRIEIAFHKGDSFPTSQEVKPVRFLFRECHQEENKEK
jgi:hypothetical protein